MKNFVLCVFILFFASFVSTETTEKKPSPNFSSAVLNSCIIQNDLTHDDIYGKSEDVVNKTYEELKMAGQRRMFGCFVACFLKRAGMMVGWEFQEDKMRELLPQILHIQENNVNEFNNIVHNCIQESKDVTPECEKVFTTKECVFHSLDERSKEVNKKLDDNHEELENTQQA